MSKKRRSLTDALSGAATPRKSKSVRTSSLSTDDLKQVNFRLNPDAARELKHLAVDNDTTLQDALTEAVNLYFEHHGRNPIA